MLGVVFDGVSLGEVVLKVESNTQLFGEVLLLLAAMAEFNALTTRGTSELGQVRMNVRTAKVSLLVKSVSMVFMLLIESTGTMNCDVRSK